MKKIFTACLGTETNTFASIPTGLGLFEETCLFRKGSYGDKVPMFGAPLDVWRKRSEAKGWQVVESLCAFAQPAGKTVKKVYEAFRDEIVGDLKAAMPVDAVFLSMHGAMVAEGYDDCESDLLAHVRKVVGPDVPVGVELDLHCNIGESTMRDATVLVLFKEYPHVDVSDRADDLFNVMEGAIEGRTKPVMATWDCRMIGVFHTTRQPMRGFVDKLMSMEGKDGVLSLSIALLFAVMADRAIRGAEIYKTLLIWPYAVAPAIAGVLWIFMFDPSLGMLARGLRSLGIAWNPKLDGTDAMTLVIMAATWKQISYNFLFFLAGLQSIPKSVIEAAVIDGARPMRRFWTIIFPLLSPTTFFLLVVNLVYVFFDTFGIIDTVTGGGPSGATTTLVYKVFSDGKGGSDLGGSAAQSVLLLIMVIGLTAVQFRFIERKVSY